MAVNLFLLYLTYIYIYAHTQSRWRIVLFDSANKDMKSLVVHLKDPNVCIVIPLFFGQCTFQNLQGKLDTIETY